MDQESKPPTGNKIVNKIKEDNERGARKNVLEELFYDFHRSRKQIFLVNFQRGIFFGIGSVVGATFILVVSALVLGLFVDLPGGIGNFVQNILDAMNRPR